MTFSLHLLGYRPCCLVCLMAIFCDEPTVRNFVLSFPRSGAHRYTQVLRNFVIPAGKRVSSAMDGNFEHIPVLWIPAIPAGMTCFLKLVYNDERSGVGMQLCKAVSSCILKN